MLQDADITQSARDWLNHMINNQFTCIISKSSADFGRTNLVEMDLPTTGFPVASKPYIYICIRADTAATNFFADNFHCLLLLYALLYTVFTIIIFIYMYCI